MSDATEAVNNLRERLAGSGEDRLGKALSDLLDNPLLTGAIGRAFDAREKAVQAQELAMGALNIPSAADVERLTRRVRSVSQRLEGIEDGVHRLDRALAAHEVQARLEMIEQQLGVIAEKLGERSPSSPPVSAPASRKRKPAKPASPKAPAKAPAQRRATRPRAGRPGASAKGRGKGGAEG